MADSSAKTKNSSSTTRRLRQGSGGKVQKPSVRRPTSDLSARRESDHSSTRERLVETARQLFWTQGYQATGVAEILREAGVNSGSLYYFYRTKEQLLLAVLDRYAELLGPEVMEPVFARARDPISRIFGVLAVYREGLEKTGYRQGCPIGNLALEMSEKSEAVRKKIAENFENWRAVIRRCLEDAGDRLVPDLDRDQLATFILTVMEGAVMQCRAFRSIAPFDASVAVLRDYFDHLLAIGGANSSPKA